MVRKQVTASQPPRTTQPYAHALVTDGVFTKEKELLQLPYFCVCAPRPILDVDRVRRADLRTGAAADAQRGRSLEVEVGDPAGRHCEGLAELQSWSDAQDEAATPADLSGDGNVDARGAVKNGASPHRMLDRRIRTGPKLSGLPQGQTLGSFDFGVQPRVYRSQIQTLGTRRDWRPDAARTG